MKDMFFRILSATASVLGILSFFGLGLHSKATQFFMQSSPVEVILAAGVIAIAIIAVKKK